ncbi:MAG: glycoside hydrolase family 97 catalytic domain-containing protein [Solirubrobacteraceae bacterium]
MVPAEVAQAPPQRVHLLVRSPGGAVVARLSRARGRLRLTVSRAGHVAVTADLGPVPAGRMRARRGSFHRRFSTPAGKRRVHRLDARRLVVRGRRGRGVEVLAARDGAAFRLLRAGVTEPTLRAPAGTRAWLQVYQGDYEGRYRSAALSAFAPERYAFPALLRTGRRYALLTESGAERGAVAHLEVRPGDRGALHVELPPGEPAPAATPWRVAVVGSLADVVGSDLPLTLGAPSRIADASWIEPGRAAWSWWSDRRSAGDLGTQRAYVDAAAAADWEYVTVDAGWDARWVPGLAAYAAARGVKLVLWFDWHDLATAAQRRRVLSEVARWGVAGVKVDFLLSDHARQIRAMDDIAAAAAAHRLVVDFHGCTVPRGIQRRWPNVLTLEGVRGAEHAASAPASPAQNVDLFFTRNAVGSMDYTPVTFSAPGRVTSAGHELAESVVFESGLQHFADTPAAYAARPLAEAFLRAVPAAWDDTRLVAGAPGSAAVVARRAGRRWFVGAITAGPARALDMPLTFLGAGGYMAHVITDGPDDGLFAADATVARRGGLRLPVARNGGFAIELTPLGG